MELHISLGDGPGDRTARIYRQIRDAIIDGLLRPGERLPATRDLARSLSVARNTVAVAYERLTAEGLLVARVGAGTFVTVTLPVAPASRPRRQPATPSSRVDVRPDSLTTTAGSPASRTRVDSLRPRPLWEALARPIPASQATTTTPSTQSGPPQAPLPASASVPLTEAAIPPQAPLYDFRVGVPDPALFPAATWRRLVAGQLRNTRITGGYADPAGHPALRAAIARYIGVSRAVRASADDVLVTNGAQQALDLVGRVLVGPGDVVAVEEPGYPPARRLFESLGACVVGVPVDADGIDVQALPAQARLVYVTPSHQLPLGTPMSLARRGALLSWAATHGAAIIEDDYDTEYRFTDRPLDPLHALDRTGRVIYVGTFSKTLVPMLRAGFLVAPATLRPALVAARQLSDLHGDQVTQAALAAFIDSGELHRHIRRATRVYAARHFSLVRAIGGELSRWLEPVPSAAGLHLCARLRPGCTFDHVRALNYRIVVEQLEDYCMADYQQSGLVLGYGGITADRIEPGLRLLADCLSG